MPSFKRFIAQRALIPSVVVCCLTIWGTSLLLDRFSGIDPIVFAGILFGNVVISGGLVCYYSWIYFCRRLSEVEDRALCATNGSAGGILESDSKDALNELIDGMGRKIQEQQQWIEALDELAEISRQLPIGIVVCESDGRIDWVNSEFESMLASSLKNLKGMDLLSLYQEVGESVFGSNSPVEVEVSRKNLESEMEYFSLYVRPYEIEGIAGQKYICIQKNTTDQRKREAESRREADRLQLAAKSADIGIWDWDVKRDNLVWDELMCSIYGVDANDFGETYHSWERSIYPDDLNQFTRTIERSLASSTDFEIVVRIVENRKQKYIENLGKAFCDSNGEVVRYVGISKDVTEKYLAERQIIEQKEEAEDLNVRLATAVKESKRAAAEAKKAVQAKSAFLATMSHEIRTPMNGVIGMSSLLLETVLDEQQKDYLNTIRVSGETLLTLINDILDYSKIESGKLDVEYAPFSIRECVEEAADLLAAKASEKGLDLVCKIDLNMPKQVVGDITRLRQVLVNLIGNATKFTDVGEIIVHATVLSCSRIHFSVKDTGIGIQDGRLQTLFEAFTQADSSITRRYGGTGLGLSISQQLVRLMGGDISVQSDLGIGTEFSFDIEVKAAESDDLDPAFEKLEIVRGKRVLLSEANIERLTNIQGLLEKWGMEVFVANSVKETLAAIRSDEAFELFIFDETLGEKVRTELPATLLDEARFLWLVQPGSSIVVSEDDNMLNKPLKAMSLRESIKWIFTSSGRRKKAAKSVDLEKDFDIGSKLPLKILVAEDNSVNQKVAKMMLRKFGYEADFVGNGLEAVEAFKMRDYELIFMDCQMPEMDGFEATRIIRSIEEERGVKKEVSIHALTANVREEALEMSKEVGMNGFLAKPIKLGDLRKSIESVTSERAGLN